MTPEHDTSLRAEGLGFVRAGRPIVDGVSLAIEPGCVTALLGPNGAGKSTLLHLLSGALAASAGEVRLCGRRLGAWSGPELARRRAVLAQSNELSFPFAVFDVVLMGRSAHAGLSSRAQDRAIAARALEVVGATGLARRSYPTLSGGERQRVQIARVMAQIWPGGDEPRFLLLDEPTNNLDLTHQRRTLAFARGLARQGVGLIAVLHDPNLAALFADRIILLSSGRIVCDGPVDAVLTEPVLERVFGVPVVVRPHPTRNIPQVSLL